MERLRIEQPKGFSRAGMRKWGMLFVILGIFGHGILQTRYLNMANLSSDQLLTMLTENPEAMFVTTVSLILLFVESMAMPIFCLLLAEGFSHTSNPAKYIARVLGVAILSEIPYNFCMGAKFFDLSSRNPVFGLVFSLVLLYLYSYFKEKKLTHILMKMLVTVAAAVWCGMLKIDDGICCVLLTCVFWWFRNKPVVRNLMGGGAAMLCSLFSMSYLAAPMVVVILHFYNGEEGDENRIFNYLFYPALLTVFAVAGFVAFGF